jgi:hypothetical protein
VIAHKGPKFHVSWPAAHEPQMRYAQWNTMVASSNCWTGYKPPSNTGYVKYPVTGVHVRPEQKNLALIQELIHR